MHLQEKNEKLRKVELPEIISGKCLLHTSAEIASDAASAWNYEVEPYVVAADVYRLPGRLGRGG